MEFNKYYQDELLFLKEMGEEFSREYPKLAPFLSRKGNDPDVERVLEGFAFIAAQLRQKLDDEFPELTHGMFSLLWPHFLRPIPSVSVVQFTPLPNALSEKKTVKKGVEIDSVPVEGTACRFKTCFDVDLYPISLSHVEARNAGTTSTIKLQFDLNGGAIEKMELDRLRLFLHGEAYISNALYLWLGHYLKNVVVRPVDGTGNKGVTMRLGTDAVTRGGFAPGEEMIPYPANSFPGYRLLQEYFALPHKFLFVDIDGLRSLVSLGIRDKFEMEFEFSRPFEAQIRPGLNNFLLYCTPVINIFERDADPIRVGHEKVEYRVKPAGSRPFHYEIFNIERVSGWVQGSGEKREYNAFVSYDNKTSSDDDEKLFYRIRRHPAVVGGGIDTYLSFVSSSNKPNTPAKEVISIELTCTNKNLPEKLREGDISVPTGSSPEFAQFRNIIPPTKALPPPMEKGLDWMLISNMALNFSSIINREALRTVLSTYNFPAFYNAQAARTNELRMEGIEAIEAEPVTLMIKGAPVRGVKTRLTLRSSKFAGEGDMYLFASVLAEFFTLFASINSFNLLEVSDLDKGEEFRWTPKAGYRSLL